MRKLILVILCSSMLLGGLYATIRFGIETWEDERTDALIILCSSMLLGGLYATIRFGIETWEDERTDAG
jgi:hypothetical protein